MILQDGFWAGLTLYPLTKLSVVRAVDIVEVFGADRICVAGACDWGPSDPLAVPRFIFEMKRRGYPEGQIQHMVFDNPVQFLGQSANFKIEQKPLTEPRLEGAAR